MRDPWEGGAEVDPWEAPQGPQANPDRQAGRELPGGLQGFFSAMQGPTLGFADEIAGAAGAVAGGIGNLVGEDDGTTWGERYRRTRDAVRGAQDVAKQRNPGTVLATQLMAGAPLMAVGAPAAGGRALGMVGQVGQSLKVGVPMGALQGAGDSEAEDLGGVLMDAGKGGLISGALGGGATLGMSAVGGVVNAGRKVLQKSKAGDFARLKVAEALARAAKGRGANPEEAVSDAIGSLRGLGPEGRVADVSGDAGMGLLDTVVNLPGASRDAASQAIRARQATRFDRLAGAADEALETGGKGFKKELDALAEARRVESFPLYEQIREAPVVLDGAMRKILAKIDKSAWKDVQKIIKAEHGVDVDVGDLLNQKALPMGWLDSVKQGLYAAESSLKLKNKGGIAEKFGSVRRELIDALDNVSPKDEAGNSIYRAARETYGGYSQMKEAMELGRKAMSEDTANLSSLISGMAKSEKEAFRIGALESLKQKMGTQSGQTQLLNWQKDRNTMERLRVIFGSEDAFLSFATRLSKEGRMKALEGVKGGSQTAFRLAGAADAEVNPVEVAQALSSPIQSVMAAASRLWGRTRIPEAVRDEIGSLMLARGRDAEVRLNHLQKYIEQVNAARSGRARAAGTFSGVVDFD